MIELSLFSNDNLRLGSGELDVVGRFVYVEWRLGPGQFDDGIFGEAGKFVLRGIQNADHRVSANLKTERAAFEEDRQADRVRL